MLNVTGDHVTWADSPYIVTLKAFDKRAGVVQARNKLEEENKAENSLNIRVFNIRVAVCDKKVAQKFMNNIIKK